jgi:hypothetical protein
MMQEDWKPKMGMVFDNIEDAWKFWVDYGGRLGFGARKQYTHKKKMAQLFLVGLFVAKKGLR